MSAPMPEQEFGYVPSRVQAAQAYLYFCATQQMAYSGIDGVPAEGRALSEKEESVREAALETLRLYFSNEMDYGDVHPKASSSDNDDPQDPVPQAV